jgi:hypothetical protein
MEPAQPLRISFDRSLDDDPDAWQFEQYAPTASHRIAVAIRRERGPDYRIVTKATVPLADALAHDGRARATASPNVLARAGRGGFAYR